MLYQPNAITAAQAEIAKARAAIALEQGRGVVAREELKTLRGSLSASHNTWSAVLWRRGEMYYGPTYDITHIVDRVGGGDSFAAGLIYGLHRFAEAPGQIIRFATAASCLKHSMVGDFNLATVEEVEKLMQGDASGRVSR